MDRPALRGTRTNSRRSDQVRIGGSRPPTTVDKPFLPRCGATLTGRSARRGGTMAALRGLRALGLDVIRPSLLALATLLAGPGMLLADWVWTPDERLTNDPHASYAGAVAADPNGNVHVVWYDDRDSPSPEIYYKRWNGTSWTPDERLTSDPSSSWTPVVAADPNGNVHVVWCDAREGDGELYYKRWNGTSWTPDERLTDRPGLDYYHSVTSDPSGRIHLVWSNLEEGVYYKHWDGTSWTTDERLVADGNFPAVAADADGNVHVAWVDGRDGNEEIYYKRWDGVAWTADERLTNNLWTSRGPAIAADPVGNVHIVWFDSRDGSYEIYYKRWDSVSWTADERLTNAVRDSNDPAVAADTGGNVHVVWRDLRDAGNKIYYKRWDGTTWTEDEQLTSVLDSLDPALAADFRSNVHVVWCDLRDVNREIYYKRAEFSANQPPVCDAGGPYVAALNVPIQFDGTNSTDPDGTVVSYEWAFGDGGTGSGPTPTHSYAAPSLYMVALTVTDNGGRAAGCSTTASIANAAPACNPGGSYAGAVGEPVLFDGTNSTDPDGTIVSYEWAFGDGATTCGERPWHEYSTVGSYTVTLCVTDNHEARSCCFTEAAVAVAGIRNGSPALSLTAPVLKQSSPNPFNPATSIAFALPTRSWTTLTIFDPAGRLVAQPFDRLADAGEYEVVWDGRGDDGATLPSGVYFYQLESAGTSLTGRMVMVK